jgi:membrane fusion protein (multidrug efflux system)
MIKAGERVGNLWLVDSGVEPGEKVIVEGIQKVRPGVKVTAKLEKPGQGAPPGANAAPADNTPSDAKGR